MPSMESSIWSNWLKLISSAAQHSGDALLHLFSESSLKNYTRRIFKNIWDSMRRNYQTSTTWRSYCSTWTPITSSSSVLTHRSQSERFLQSKMLLICLYISIYINRLRNAIDVIKAINPRVKRGFFKLTEKERKERKAKNLERRTINSTATVKTYEKRVISS